MTPAVIDEAARAIFAHLCHQQPERAWLVGGELLPLCARCTGVYAGAAVALLAVPFLPASRPRAAAAAVTLAVAQMIVLGVHLVPLGQPAWLRTLSGQVFALGLVTLLALPLCPGHAAPQRRWPWFAFTALAGIGALQAALACGPRVVATLIELLALVGVVALPVAALAALAVTLRRALRLG